MHQGSTQARAPTADDRCSRDHAAIGNDTQATNGEPLPQAVDDTETRRHKGNGVTTRPVRQPRKLRHGGSQSRRCDRRDFGLLRAVTRLAKAARVARRSRRSFSACASTYDLQRRPPGLSAQAQLRVSGHSRSMLANSPKARFDGIFVLRSNTHVTPLRPYCATRELLRVEQLFRQSKSVFDTRSILH